jgi:uncharacterized protein
MERTERRPLFLANWMRALFIHFETDPATLQNCVPFPLDLRDGRAYVSLVAFTMERMRLSFAGSLGEWMLRAFSSQRFLNVRTYVRAPDETGEVGEEVGIYFLAEWLSSRLSVPLGPVIFGLPYHFARLEYRHDREADAISGQVTPGRGEGRLAYQAKTDASDESEVCAAGSLEEFLMERYTAFTQWRGKRRFFRVWHDPWPQTPMREVHLHDLTLLAGTGGWARRATCIGANFSDGVRGVWMGRPHRMESHL